MARDNKETAAPKKAPQSWDDQVAGALPQKAEFFNAIRTNAYENLNLVANYVEFWVAMQVDPKQDKWRVMHYMIFDLDQPDGKFRSEIVSKEDMTFPEAVYQIAKFDETSTVFATYKTVDLTEEKYPADKYPELKVHYFEIPHYRLAANIEGIAFDEAGAPYRRVEGRIFSEGNFKRSEVAKSILSVEQAMDNPKVAQKIEGGVLSDIFNSVSGRDTSLDKILEVGQVFACLDSFAAQMAAFYLCAQRQAGVDDKFEKLENLSQEDKKSLHGKASFFTSASKNVSNEALLQTILLQADKQLDAADKLGVHTEPFRKFVAECELYTHLLRASQNLKKLQEGFSSVGNTDTDLILGIKDSVNAAQRTFLELGGTIEQVDRLKAWVATPQKDPIPQWIPGFIDRYYDSRRKVMKKVQERQASAVRVAKTMPADVKPPLI